MIVGVAALSVSIADRSGRWILRLRPLVGVLWMILLVMPWFVAILDKAGEAFLSFLRAERPIHRRRARRQTHQVQIDLVKAGP